MAQPIICDGEDSDAALFIVQNVQQAEILAFCPADFLGFCIFYIAAVAPDMLAKEEPKPRRKRTAKSAVDDAVADALQNASDEESGRAGG